MSMRVEWSCASMISGGQYVMTAGTALMQLWSASSWDMQPLEVSAIIVQFVCFLKSSFEFTALPVIQVEFHIAMLGLVLVLAPSTWMMLLVHPVLASYWSVLVVQFQDIIVLTLQMLVWDVKVAIALSTTGILVCNNCSAICLHYSSLYNWSTTTCWR